VTALVLLVVSAGGVKTAVAISASPPRWPTHPDWGRFVEGPATADIHPVRVVSSSGSVTGARFLTEATGTGTATLTMEAGGTPPTIVIDYGKDVGGVPYFVVRSESGSPVLRSSYSEGRQYIGPQGDKTPSSSSAGDESRVDNLTVIATGRWTTGLIQGGERYERITLASPGTIRLSSIGIHFTAVRATPNDYRGWFDSSSASLDRIWYDGAYTTQLDELPAGTVVAPWRVTAGALDAQGGVIDVLHQGAVWTDYTMSFDTRVINKDTSWVVRASSSSGYLFVLGNTTDEVESPVVLQEVAFGPAEFSVIGHVTLPRSFDALRWNHVTTVTSGAHITTSIDGRQVAAFDTGSLPSGTSVYGAGSVGFATLGAEAAFRDLDVTAPDGATLYANSLAHPSALTAFAGPNVTTPDPLPVIMDGAKRDRVVWSGDLAVEGPNVFYTTGADSIVRGSLQLLGSYQEANGESGTNVPPTVPLGSFPETGYNYSTSYSMDEVVNIATYYLYTGDLSFVRSEWPMVTRELAYDASLVDSHGLLVTNAGDGQDWDYYDGSKLGEVTAYNDIYYRTLNSAVTLADALGLGSQGAGYADAAATLRAAINRYLFDPATGLYSVSNLQPGAVAQDANSLAVLFGVAPKADDATVLAALRRTLPSTRYGPLPFTANAGYRAAVSPFVTNDEVAALFTTGATATATALVETLWGYMDGPGPDATGADWELVGAHGLPGFGDSTSLAHGWSSGATADLSSYVLGVQPSTAGFRTWLVEPHPGSLSWVEGNVPTPHGTIDVRWAQDLPSGRFALQVTGPKGTSGTISVPVPRSGARVTVSRPTTRRNHASTRTMATAAGSTHLALTVAGGVTYDIDVVPR
jgi:alpha-L-rhamnosidase